MIPRPIYGGFSSDLYSRGRVKVIPVSSEGEDPMGEGMIKHFAAELERQRLKGVRVRAMMISNPHNPLGKCYSKEAIVAYMKFCQESEIHFISDEIYALSVFETANNKGAFGFTSAFSIETEGVIAKERCHIIYGMSKDFAANGLRMGVLISKSEPVLYSMRAAAIPTWCSSISELFIGTLLADKKYLDWYIKENQRVLGEHYNILSSFLDKHKIEYLKDGNAAFFIWTDFGSILGSDIVVPDGEVEAERKGQISRTSAKAREKDDWFWNKLVDEGVYIATGERFWAEKHGWYRVNFAVKKPMLELGLKRLEGVLNEIKGAGTTSLPIR
jgi:aspartate/methionine/tyrosine aminotransferase